MSTDPLRHEGEVRTDLYCHNCSKNFIALLNYSLEGNHVIECPHCFHEHCRTIKAGKITDARWDGRNQRPSKVIRATKVWKHNVLPIQTSAVSHFLRQKWLDKMDN